MNKKIKKIIFLILPIALGVFLVWYFLSKLTPEDKSAIIGSFKSANYWWVLLSLVLGALSHLSRAYRWQFMLKPMGYKPKFANSVMTVFIAYLVNLGIPRAGEIARATGISKYENIPFEKAFGTIVAERIADAIVLLSIIGLAFFLQADLISQYLFKDGDSGTQKYFVIGIFALFAIIFYFIVKKSKNPFFIKIKKFINGLIEGAISIFKMENKWSFIFHTLFIWAMYVLMFYVVTFALPETSNLPFEAIIVGFVVGGISMAVTNGGLGTYPIAVASVLILYAVPDNPARAFAWIMWTAQTLMVLLFGALSFLILPIYNRNKI
ncbi:lysylphosphatidylglycerol synthase transmembrane domain-containing protein [Aureibaculum sp. 2210JD6-5]|uniref:lysylphosphatidylglycerol synthase transmembrane domain-containing protein n=1 Tax=Aureibaculum sp. 2210JD6-5 TaxID=3103957 RepID=UPI002AAE25D6|nr:lysylphosphatidylglycerol synthase transmembrane domain-containing protein [Aureibaculum sp. 2210JD6-5]MDY7396830.1 lysylphosphatidylglycerol synthase transmembrane domain-containing protein [Aureibaculum sp. 2210JD6-5]